MSIALLVMTDGRFELLEKTLRSFREQVSGEISYVFVNDDSANPPFTEWLTTHVRDLIGAGPTMFVRGTQERSGFGGAIRNAWAWMHSARRLGAEFDWVFHLEDDFTFNYKVELDKMIGLLIDYPYLAQMALKRQPWGSDAAYANGFMEKEPASYTQCEDDDDYWIETTRNWTTNPSVFRAELLAGGWPEDPFSEGKYGFQLKEGGLPWRDSSTGELVPGGEVRFGIFGRIDDPPLVHHTGDYRVGTMY